MSSWEVTQTQSYNILPIHNLQEYPEVHAVLSALSTAVCDLRKPPYIHWLPSMDLLDWLSFFFGFQSGNVQNQREHLCLHLANAQMRLTPPPLNRDTLQITVLSQFRVKLFENYINWCSYLGKKPNLCITSSNDCCKELLYVGLYLLIWGESANLRFMPECICYIFHHMAMEMNRVLEHGVDESSHTGLPLLGENAFLNYVVKPIYGIIRVEVEKSKNGTAPHSTWRNYDDFNEYFWSEKCFENLKWPIVHDSDFFHSRGSERKTGFVEHRTFWNVYRSFDRLWVMLALFLQLAVIMAWEEERLPWRALYDKDVRVRALTLFITWSWMRFFHALLELAMKFDRVLRETWRLVLRMVMKILVAAAWTCVFVIYYRRIWVRRKHDRTWSNEANKRIIFFLQLAFIYGLPELLELVLFFLPCIWSFIEHTNVNIYYLLSWWFHGSSFVGHGLREGLVDSLKYVIFWFVVLSTKFTFSYFLQIKPLVRTTKELLNLKNVESEWDQLEHFSVSKNLIIWLLWLPVLLIYLADTQIWFSLYHPFVGVALGFLQSLGKIRNIHQFRLRFQLLASAIKFNLMPQDEVKISGGTLREKFYDVILRLKLRCGFKLPFKKFELNPVMARKFALIWNEIITTFREEDIVSDREFELLELPQNSWNTRVIGWPCFLLANELLLAIELATDFRNAPDRWLWYKICKNDYRRCAVIETYECLKHLLDEVIYNDTEEHSIVNVLFLEIDRSIESEKFTMTFNMNALPRIHVMLIKLLELLLKPKRNAIQVVNTLQVLYVIVVNDFQRVKRTANQLREDGLAPRKQTFEVGLLFENAVKLPDPTDENFYKKFKRLHTILTTRDTMPNVPANIEARRRLAFFSSSLFMKMPNAPQVDKMMAFSVLTPFYNEDVLYSKRRLLTRNEDGISILYYLQTIYDDEWKNFIQRMRRQGMVREDELWTTKLRDLRLWASYRGQTLARTVRGMMYYNRALKMLAFLDSASETDISEKKEELGFTGREWSSDVSNLEIRNLHRSSNSSSFLLKGHENVIVSMKYTYVVSCQIYAEQKAENNPCATEISDLLKNNEALRIAYVDKVSSGEDEEYYSVLVKYDQQLQKEVEIYRIKLPGPFIVGEGKPENQNHGLIFTRGDAVQTIDMNQDNYFEEAIKIRNLLEEFKHDHGIRKPTILGIREHIFTGSVSSLAWFMSAQETSFVTLVQRVFTNPLKIRMHYGHPDIFDRFWFLTRGGISKASKVINLSEDIFAGFNCTLRGGSVTHHEYIQVGKGRDLGMNQISMFEAKIACGNGEQFLSRDVFRLGQRLEFFRMLSFFHTTVGYFFNTTVVILTVYAFLWCQLYLALSGIENSVLGNDQNSKTALTAVVNQELIIQFGLFTTLPAILESSVENGFLEAIWEFLLMQLQLSTVFYTFSMGTRVHFFGQTILHGGAKYQATGRDFVVHHTSFAENYRLYARSHFIKAIELGLILTIYAIYSPAAKGTFFYIDMTVMCWFLVISWLMAPFVFNPSGFDWLKTVEDFEDFMEWIWYEGGVFAKDHESWEKWWYEQHDHLRRTSLWEKLLKIVLDLRFFVFQYGIVYHLGIAHHSKSVSVYLLSWISILVAFGIYLTMSYFKDKHGAKEQIYFRLAQLLLIISGILIIYFKLTYILTSLVAFIPSGWGLLSIALVFRPFLQNTRLWNVVVSVARLYDILFGVIVMAPVAFLSWMPGFQLMQTRIMFNDAFSKGLQMFKIITGRIHQKDV